MGMDPMDAILASMAAATGNAPQPPPPPSKATSSSSASREVPSETSKKRARESESTTGIWNPTVEQQVDDSAIARAPAVGPAMEIARQQTVRQLVARIRRAAEELGISKLPNSALESWQFTAQLTVADADPLIPNGESDYSGLLEELVKAGATKSAARKQCKALAKEADRLLRRFRQHDGGGQRRHVKVSTVDGGEMRQLTYGKVEAKLTTAHFAKLRDMFARRRSDSVTQHQREFESALFSLLLRYDSLDGGGFQAALNEECFDVLLRHFDCKMECFASPLNSRYSRFCSAFLDTDRAFGSVGSFFDFSPRSGCFEANPPFIPKLIKRMAEHMTALLEQADGALAFIVIIPAWKETEGWQQLYKSRFNQQHVLIPQKDHGYCEGKQQIRKTRWRIASFDTSVFFWQNARAQNKWPVSDSAVADLRNAFQSKQAEERDAKGLRHSGKRVKSALA